MVTSHALATEAARLGVAPRSLQTRYLEFATHLPTAAALTDQEVTSIAGCADLLEAVKVLGRAGRDIPYPVLERLVAQVPGRSLSGVLWRDRRRRSRARMTQCARDTASLDVPS